MSLARFVESLFADGRVRVASAVDRNGALIEPSSIDLDLTASILKEFESYYRDDLPGIPPELSGEAMLWGALTVFRASSFLAHRDSATDVIHRAMDAPCPEVASPSVCYSVDLTLRFLPDLIRLAKAASSNDPLVEILTAFAHQWPLSSVGVADVGPVDTKEFIEHECLRRLYVDRIIATKDRSRMDEPKVREAVHAAIGLHPELAPELALRERYPDT